MANFCPKCGKKINPDDRFCKNCGATLIGSVEVLKEELIPEKTPVPMQIPSKPSKPIIIQIISAGIQLLLLGLILYLVYYSYNCATGKYPNTGDQMCQSIRQAFSSGVSGGHAYGTPCTGSEGKTGLYGTDGHCYTCSQGTVATNPITNNCSGGVAGVYCCVAGTAGGGTTGGGTGSKGCIPTGCGSLWRCTGTLYAAGAKGVGVSVDSCFPSGMRPSDIPNSIWNGTCRQCP